MDYDRTFKPQMNRLAAAYRVEIPAMTMAAYWTVFSASDDHRFADACKKAMDTERTFPPPAALKAIMRTAAEVGRRDPTAHGPELPSPPVYPDDLDVPRYPHKATHAVGSPAHKGFVANSASLIGLLEGRLSERMGEMETDSDPDLARRVAVLSCTLSRQYEWHEHYERTGESLREDPPKPGKEGASIVSRFTADPPPEGFSKADGKVPLMGADRARDQQRRQIAANIQAVAAKLKKSDTSVG
jgi:hypothetical protein